MYSVTYGGKMLYRSGAGVLSAYELHLSETENGPAEFSFQMSMDHPLSEILEAGRAEIVVYESRDGTLLDEHEIFRGKITGIRTDFQNGKQVECTGVLNYLANSIQRPGAHRNKTVTRLLSELLEEHNRQVSPEECIYPGSVTVSGIINGCMDYMTTLECMEELLLKAFDGRFIIRRQGGKNYLDYLSGYRNAGGQPVEFGRNLLDFSQNMDASEIYTVCIPLGARQENSSIEGLDAYLTIESVNGGKDYVENPEGAALYGRRAKAVSWKDVTSPEELKRKGEEWLISNQYEMLSLEVSAIDLSMAGEEFESFRLGDETLVYSRPHGLNRRFPITKRDRYLDAPEKNSITLGKSVAKGIVGSIRSGKEEIKEQLSKILPSSEILSQARKSATELITAAMNGYVVTSPDEILIMDAPEKEDAKKVWRWNLGGLGYSRMGYQGPYETAMTMDGEIVADFIQTGNLSADRIKSGSLSADRIGGGTIEGDVVAKNLTIQGGRIDIDAVAEDQYPNVIKLSHEYTNFMNYTEIAPGEIVVRSTNAGEHRIGILSDEIVFRTKEDGTFIGFNDARRIQNMRFGTKVLAANGSSVSIPVLTQTDLNDMFGGTGFSGSNTMVSFANGDGHAQSVHIEGAAFIDGAWYATFNTAPAEGMIRINYMVSYFG